MLRGTENCVSCICGEVVAYQINYCHSNEKGCSILNRFRKNLPMLLNLSFSVLIAESPLANLRRAMELFGHSFAVRHRPRRSEKSFDDATSLKSSGFLHCHKICHTGAKRTSFGCQVRYGRVGSAANRRFSHDVFCFGFHLPRPIARRF